MHQCIIFGIALLSVAWSVLFLWNPVSVLWGTLFNDCHNGFAYDPVSKRCNCELPFNGSLCELDLCLHGTPVRTSYGWQCDCENLWTGAYCDLCGAYDASGECRGLVPFPNGNKCRTELVADGVEVEFMGASCDLVCVKAENVRSLQGAALERYEFYLAKAPLDTLACPGSLCWACDPQSREALCLDGALKSFGSRECDIACGPDRRPCNRRGLCRLLGDQPQCQCEPETRGKECEVLCPGVAESFNGLTTILSGEECTGRGQCNEGGQCECLEDSSGNALFLGEACTAECPTDSAGLVCSGHGSCQLSGTGAACACDAGWTNPNCGCSDGTTAAKTCIHGECLADLSGCSCHDSDLLGHWTGEFCSQCAEHWFSPSSFCLQYCNPQTTCNGNAAYCEVRETVRNDEGLVVPCTVEASAEGLSYRGTCAQCACDATFNASLGAATDGLSLAQQCGQCVDDYYPKVGTTPDPPEQPFCSVQCDADKCHQRGACLRSSGGCACHGSCPTDASLFEGECHMLPSTTALQPRFVASDDCGTCAEHWQPDVKGKDFWQSSCRYYCNPSATESDALPSACYTADGYVRPECVFCSGRADNCSSVKAVPSCNCKDGYAGAYCQSTCGANGEASCGEGTCVSDDLANWFDLDTPVYRRNTDPEAGRTGSWRCACDPQDGAADRAAYEEGFYALSKYGMDLATATEELPPRAEYFGLQCSANCPRVAGKACDGRGYCRSVRTGLQDEHCTVDADCSQLGGLAEDSDRYCYLEKKPLFWDYLSRLPPATLTACSATELEWMQSFVDTHDWNRFCYSYMKHAVPPEAHSTHCRGCEALVTSTELWQEIDAKCERLVEFANFETLQGFTGDCSGQCTMAVASFDWDAWCAFPSADFEGACSATCLAGFRAVDWVSDKGFCATLEGFLKNHRLVGEACAVFREEDQARGRDHDTCALVGAEGSDEYELSSSCFVARETVRNEFGAVFVQPYSGTNHQIQCKGVQQNQPEVCGSTEHLVPYNASLAEAEDFAYCSVKYPLGWSNFAAMRYVVETRQTNHSAAEYTTSSREALLVAEVEEVLGGPLRESAAVVYRAADGRAYEGVLVGECRLRAPICYSCGPGDSLRNGSGAILPPAVNPRPERCCSPSMSLQASPDQQRFWCHEADSVGVENCRYAQCKRAVEAYDWKTELSRMDRVQGLDGADIEALSRASVRRGLSLEGYCGERKALDDRVRLGASGVGPFQEYCEFVAAEAQVYGIGAPLAVDFFEAFVGAPPEQQKLDLAKSAWWQSLGLEDPLASYEERFWYLGQTPTAKPMAVLEELPLTFSEGTRPTALSVWLYLPAADFRNVLRLSLGDSLGSLRWVGSTTGRILVLEVRRGKLYVNYKATEVSLAEVAQWYHLVLYLDWDTKRFDLEFAESFSVRDEAMLCATESSQCHVFATETVYNNFLLGLYAEKRNATAGVYDAPYREGNASASPAECQAQSGSAPYFAHSQNSGLCHFYDSLDASMAFIDTSATDPSLFVYEKNGVLESSVSLSELRVTALEAELALHDLRLVAPGLSLVGTYLHAALNGGGRSDTVSAADCTAFLARPSGAYSLDTLLGGIPELDTRRWGRICEDFFEVLRIPKATVEGFCLGSEVCEQAVGDFVESGAASWFEEFARHARPNATRQGACGAETEACDRLLETYDYEEACQQSLREVYESCEGSCAETFRDWRAGQTMPAFNKTDFCQSLELAKADLRDSFQSAVAPCGASCRAVAEDLDYLGYCSERLITHDRFAPHVMSHNLSSYCKRQVFDTLVRELEGTENSLNYTRDCRNLGERGSTKLVNDKPGVCHRVLCECTAVGMSGERCNVECIMGTAEPNSPCNEAVGLGMCCLAPPEGQELSFLNCRTDYNPDASSYTVGECLCLNRGTSDLISGVNCDAECAKCSEAHGECSKTSGTCVCRNNEYMETIRSHEPVVRNASYDAQSEDSEARQALFFDWANAETTDGALEGDTRTQVPLVLLYDASIDACKVGLDRCCDWQTEEAKNPLDPAYAYNQLDGGAGASAMSCPALLSYEECLEACLKDAVCDGIVYGNESTKLLNKRAQWPFVGQIMLSEFALVQEPLNYLPQTKATEGLTGGKCRSYSLQAGRYRVLLQDGLYKKATSCGIGSGTSQLLETRQTVREAYVACQSRRDCSGFTVEAGAVKLFSGYTTGSCALETHARPALLPRPVATSKEVLYRTNWCRVKDYFDLSGAVQTLSDRAFGLVGSIDCSVVEAQHPYAFQSCQFPFYLPVWDQYRGEFVVEKFTSCTDLNIVDGYLGKTVSRDAGGLAQSSILLDFQSMKSEITALTGILEPKYCISEIYLRNISEHLEREGRGEAFSACRKNEHRRSKCTRDSADSGEGNCKCGGSVCGVNDYCYEKPVGDLSVYECHKCDDLLSPAPEQCCKVGESLQFVRDEAQHRCVAPDDPDYIAYCNRTWGCPRNWGSSTAVGQQYAFEGALYDKGSGPRPELFCENDCWNYALGACSCTECQSIFPSPLSVLRGAEGGSKVGGLHGATYATGTLGWKGIFEGDTEAHIPIPFLRICKDPMAGAINNSQFAFNAEEEKHYRDAEFIRSNKATETNPSSRCGVDCQEVCPGVDPDTEVPCNNRGQCNSDCQCACFSLDTISSRTFFLTELRGGGLGALPDYSISSTNSPYRGAACEGLCPGFDERYEQLELSDNDKLYIMKELVCSGHGTCLQSQTGDTQCSCEAGFKSGSAGACEFHCPGKDGLCNGHGQCNVEPIGSSRAFVDGLVRIYADLLEEEMVSKLTVATENSLKKVSVVLAKEKLLHRGALVSFTGMSTLGGTYEVAKVESSTEFFFYSTDLSLADGDYFNLGLRESEFASYDPRVLAQTVSHRMTSYVYDTNALESAYSATNNRYYISPEAREAVDSLLPQVKYLSQCPDTYPFVYHHGLYCCQFEHASNGTFLNKHSKVSDCPRRQRMQCPTIEWFEQERGLLENFGSLSRFINKDGKTSLSFFCRKTVLTTAEEALCKVERQTLADNIFSTNPFHYTCDRSIDMARMVRDNRPYYDSWAILELGAGRADGLLYTYKDTHCKNIVATELNSNGLSLDDQPQAITLLECAICQCQNSADSGFWQGVGCDSCNYGFSGEACKGTCPGVCSQIAVGANLMWYEEYQNALGITQPCANPRRDGFFYSCPTKENLKEITIASGRVWDDGDIAQGGTDTGYERAIFCQDGRDASGSCVRCKTPMVGTIDLAFEEAPERSCSRLSCPRMDGKLKSINQLEGEFSIDLALSMWQSNFVFELYGGEPEVAYEAGLDRGLSRSLPIDLFEPCPATHKDIGENTCCLDSTPTCVTLKMETLSLDRQLSLYHNGQTLTEQECAALALSTDPYPIYANGQVVAHSPSSYYKASKGFFSHYGTTCRVYKGFEAYSLEYYYRAPTTEAAMTGLTAFTNQVKTSEEVDNFRAFYSCDSTCREKPVSKQLRRWAATRTDAEHSTAVTTTYELACVYNNDYASILVEGSDDKEDGLLERSLDPYLDSDGTTSSIVELVSLIQKDKCTMRFFQMCEQGHNLQFQNPFLSYYAFMKLDEYLDEEYPEGANQANRCDWSLYLGRLWCPQCPRCSYKGQIPGLDLELSDEAGQECELGYFPYCKAATAGCTSSSWQSTANCALPSFAPAYQLVDAQRQTVDLVNATKHSLGLASRRMCALKAMTQTKKGFFFFAGCETDECECFYYSDIPDASSLELVTNGYLYSIDYSSTYGEINVFERYIQQFMKDSPSGASDAKGWMVEKMRQAVPDKYRAFSVELNGTFLEEHRQWLECSCVVATGNEAGRDWCADFDVTRCVYWNPVQLEWELLWYDQGIRSDGVPPAKELGQLHDPKGSGAVLRSGGRLKADVERIVVSVPDTCTEVLPDPLSVDYDNTQFIASQLECNKAEEIHCQPTEGNRSTGHFDFRPERVRDGLQKTIPHYRCKEKVATGMSIDECANEAQKRFAVYNGTTWLSRGYFAVERPQLDSSLFSAHTDYEIYNFEASNELTCYVYKDIDLLVARSSSWNSLSESFCASGTVRKNDYGCPRAATLYTSKEANCTDCDANLPALGGECEEPEFVRTYYVPNLSDAGGFPAYTLTPLETGSITCYAYGPCFTATKEWLGCRPTMLTGEVPSLHYPMYSETPLHDATDAQKAALGISTSANYLENMLFDASFGHWTEVRDAPTGSIYQTYKEDWLNMCYDDMDISDKEAVLLANRELYRANDYTQYNLLYADLLCPAFAEKHRAYHASTEGQFAASRWADGTRRNADGELMRGSGHTKLVRIRVGEQQSNYVHAALVILDNRTLDASKITIGDPAYAAYKTEGISYDQFIKPYCDAGVQLEKPYGACVDLQGAAVNGKLYWKQLEYASGDTDKVSSFRIKEFPLKPSSLPYAVDGDLYVEHDCVILVYESGKYYPLQGFQALSEQVLAVGDFKLYKDTSRVETAHAEEMFGSLYRSTEAGLAWSGEACAPVSQDLTGLKSTLKAADYGGTASAEGGMRFFRPQTLQVVKGLSDQHTKGFGPSCGCKAGFANVRYSDYNQPWQLQAGCSAPEGDSTGTMIDYKPCFGANSCAQYTSTPLCAGFDISSDQYDKVCVNAEGEPEIDVVSCNRPFGGCQFGQKGALNVDSGAILCKSATGTQQNHNFMSADWLSPHAQNFALDPNSPRTQYTGTDENEGVVYVNGEPKDKAKSNFNFLTSSCNACSNGRYQDETNSVECKACALGFYNTDLQNPWRIPPAMNLMGSLPENRWKDPNKPSYEYEWWKIAGFPSTGYEWHEINEWQVMAPLPAYYLDGNGKWQYDSMRSLKPQVNLNWAVPKQVQTGCAKCMDNFASIPLSLECTDPAYSAADCPDGQLLHQVGDTREGYNYPAMGNRGAANRNCLSCPPGYDTGIADHINGGDSPSDYNGMQECPIDYPHAFSTKEQAPYYGSHCCNEAVDRIGDQFSYSYFYDTAEEACPSGTCFLARKDSVCMLASYGTPLGETLLTRRSVKENNLEYCNAVARRKCTGLGHSYELSDHIDACRCHAPINDTEIPINKAQTLTCFARRLWKKTGDCEYTKFIGKRHQFDIKNLEREKAYSLHLTRSTNRASAQYSEEAEAIWDVNPYDIIESMPVSHRINLTLDLETQCEAMASAEAKVHRYSVNRITGECLLVYYVDDSEQQSLQEDTQVCLTSEGWTSYELQLSAKDTGNKDTFFFTKEICESYVYKSTETEEAWAETSLENTTEAHLLQFYEKKRPYGAAVEKLPNASMHLTFRGAALECFDHINCIGIATESTMGVVQHYFAARHDEAFRDIIKDQEEQSLFYYRKKVLIDRSYDTVGYYMECQPFAGVEGTVIQSKEMNCTYDPNACYRQCRAFAEAVNASAFVYPSFPLGEGMPSGALCHLYEGESMFKDIGKANDYASPTEYLQQAACVRFENHFGGGFVQCDADYTQSGMEATNGFYCVDYDYRIHESGYNGGDVSLDNILSQKKTCLVEEVSPTGICETNSVLGTCTSYNAHGTCQTFNYKGLAKFPSPNTTVTEQDQRGTCVHESQEGECTTDAMLGKCTETSLLKQNNLYENPLGQCTHKDGTVTIGKLAECDNMLSYEAFDTQVIGNFNAEALYYGPVKQMHMNALTTIKQLRFLTEDTAYYCEKACTDTNGCLAYSFENRVPEPKELAPWHTPSFRNCSLFAGPIPFSENVSASHTTLFDGDGEDLFYYKSTVYSGRANSDAELVILRDLSATGTACMTACDNEPLCVGYAYNATGVCELLGARPDRASLYKREGPLVPSIETTRGAYSTFDEAYSACERRSVPFNPYKQRLVTSKACVGIRNQSNTFALIESVHYGGISVVAEGQVFNDSSCYVEHASVTTAADCEAFAQSVPFPLAFDGEEQRYAKVSYFSHDSISSLCRVIKAGHTLDTCVPVAGTGLLYKSIGENEVRMTIANGDIVYTNRRDAGSLNVSPTEHALFDGGYHGSLGECSKSLGNVDTSMECIKKGIEEPAELIETNQSLVADTNGTCERLNDRGTVEQPNQLGYCKGQSEYGDCVREVPHGVCTRHSGKGQCIEYSTCKNTILGKENKGRCLYENAYGRCTYQTRLGVCRKESLLGQCTYEDMGGSCSYNKFDGECTYAKTDYEVEAWLESLDGSFATQLEGSSGIVRKDGFNQFELPVLPYSAYFVPYNGWFREYGYGVQSLEELKSLCIGHPSCTGISPQAGTWGTLIWDSVGVQYTDSMRMKRRSIELDNERDFHSGTITLADSQNNTVLRLSLGGSLEPDDKCELECQKAAMLTFDGTNTTQQWLHQVDESGTCLCSPTDFVRCPFGGSFLRLSNSTEASLFNYRSLGETLPSVFYNPPMSIASLTKDPAELTCEPCPMGTYEQNEVCHFCPDGYYNDQIGQTECTKKCPAGRFYSDATRKANTALWGQAECTNCAVGEYQNEEGKNTCKTCSAGQYQDTTGNSGCKNCPAGKATDLVLNEGNTDRTECQSCGVGYYSGYSGNTYCQPCSAMYWMTPQFWGAGKYQNEEGKTSCKTCGLTETTYSNAASACVSCPTGTRASSNYIGTCGHCWYGEYQDQLGQTTCKTCAAGQYSSQTGRSSCSSCDTGRYSGGGATECTVCQKGKYQDSGGQSSCKNCPAGRYQSQSSTSDSSYHNSVSDCNGACPMGRYSNAGTFDDTGPFCTGCPTGKYAGTTGTVTCSDCPAGKYQDSTGGSWDKTTLGDTHILGSGYTVYTVYSTGQCIAICDANGFSLSSYATNSVRCRCGYEGTDHQPHAYDYGTGVYAPCKSCEVYSTWTLGGVSDIRKYIASGTGASSCTSCTGCQVANDDYTSCVNGPQYAFREGFGVETTGSETLRFSGGSSCGTMASGTDYSFCLERCYAACANWHGFIVRTDGRCWCENHGGYKATQTCSLTTSSNYHMYGIVKCGSNGASRPDSNWREYGDSLANRKPCNGWHNYLGNHNHDTYGYDADHYILQPVPAYTKVYDGECTSGSEYRQFEGNGDNSGPTYIDECARRCTGYVSFIILSSGRCYCENKRVNECTLASSAYDKYDFD